MTNIKYVILISLIVLSSCYPSSPAPAQRNMGDTTITNRIVTFPGGAITKEDSRVVFLRNVSKAMEMSDIAETLADVNIRIWLWDEDVKYVINLEKNGPQFSCDAIGFNAINTDSGETLIIHNKVVNLQPQSGWSQISKKIAPLEQVLSSEPYPGRLGDLTGMSYVDFERYSKGTYTLTRIPEPSYHRFIYKDALTIHDFLKTINDDFHMQAYMPLERFYAEPPAQPR
ncbi:MAG: hypothetical protein EOP48_06650 [Sphingobacteriales bacterium]|nr:MAG: hypothetical protein EOP48_06650 [Sphingobacteriales bacterium]